MGRLLLLAFSGVSLGSAVYLLGGDDSGAVDGTAITGLTAAALVALILFLGGTTLIRRIRRFGPQGVEIDPGTRETVDQVLSMPRPPSITYPKYSPEGPSPWFARPLTPEQRWYYELGSDALMHFQHFGLELRELKGGDLKRFRELTLWVGRASLIDDEPVKALVLLRKLEPLRDLTSTERLFLATAYLFVALEDYMREDGDRRRYYLEQAKLHLQKGCTDDPANALIRWTEGYVYDELGHFKLAIQANKKAITIDANFGPWAYWHIAISYLKMDDIERCFRNLEDVEAGELWDEIYGDEELQPLKDEYSARFWGLFRRKWAPERKREPGRTNP